MRAAIKGGGRSSPCLSWETKYAITATKPEIDSHKNALARGSSSDSTLNRIIPSWSQLSPAVPYIPVSTVFKHTIRTLSPAGNGFVPVQTVDGLPRSSSLEYFSLVAVKASTLKSSSKTLSSSGSTGPNMFRPVKSLSRSSNPHGRVATSWM